MALEVEYFQLDSTQASNKYVELAGTPMDALNVAMDTIGGTAQARNNDFGVDMTTSAPTTYIRWAGYNLDGQLVMADRIRIIYDRS